MGYLQLNIEHQLNPYISVGHTLTIASSLNKHQVISQQIETHTHTQLCIYRQALSSCNRATCFGRAAITGHVFTKI